MFELIAGFVAPLGAILALVFLAVRLGFMSGRSIGGRTPFLFGSIILMMVLVWKTITLLPEYDQWFVTGAYAILANLHISLAVVGVLLVVIGFSLYADFWQMRSEDIESRERRSSLLSDLQVAAREPYQVLQLLDIALKEMLSQVTECAGATFLVNRQRRQLVFTGGLGLSKKETAAFEHLGYDRNPIVQAIDLAEPLLFGRFEAASDDGKTGPTRFESCLVLPMVSGADAVGAVVLMSTQTQRFARGDVSLLAPVAGWLAEKIRSARLVRQNTTLADRLAGLQQIRSDLLKRLSAISRAFADDDPVEAFCQSLVGLLGAQEVFLVSLSEGAIGFYGGSLPAPPLTEAYRTALSEAIGRNKPLVINQEATTEDGRVHISQSTLVYPLSNQMRMGALLLRKDNSTFDVQEDLLKLMATLVRLAEVALEQADSTRLDLTRRKGLGKILELLQFDFELPTDLQPKDLVGLLDDILPAGTITIGFIRQDNGSFLAECGQGLNRSVLPDFDLMPGEGFVGQTARLRETLTYSDRTQIDRELQRLEVGNREAFYRVFGERGTPVFMLATPVIEANEVAGIVVVFMSELSESDRPEWERMLTLAVGLFSFRRTIAELYKNLVPLQSGGGSPVMGTAVNRLNNYLSGIVGNAELAQSRADISGDVKAHLESIISGAEQAGQYLRTIAAETVPPAPGSDLPPGPDNIVDINVLLEITLSKAEVADRVYMVAGHAVEIDLKLRPGAAIIGGQESLSHLFFKVLGHFARLADDDEMVTVSTYRLGDSVYLDVSRHGKSLPPLERLAGVVSYVSGRQDGTAEASFLGETVTGPGQLSLDQSSPVPTYISFKFPAATAASAVESSDQSRIKVLVADDQKVILDLVSAMCLSLGYAVKTVSEPQAGIRLAASEHFDVILIDLAMPGMSGLDMAARIRDRQSQVPIILLTGWEVGVDQDRLRRVGISKVLHKPFRMEQLTDALSGAVGSKSLK
ncbi:MAG: response regulator [bacterium]